MKRYSQAKPERKGIISDRVDASQSTAQPTSAVLNELGNHHSFVVMNEMQLSKALTTDSHFVQAGFSIILSASR